MQSYEYIYDDDITTVSDFLKRMIIGDRIQINCKLYTNLYTNLPLLINKDSIYEVVEINNDLDDEIDDYKVINLIMIDDQDDQDNNKIDWVVTTDGYIRSKSFIIIGEISGLEIIGDN